MSSEEEVAGHLDSHSDEDDIFDDEVIDNNVIDEWEKNLAN